MLTNQDLERYDRQILINEIGRSGQEKLSNARVLICGAGGLGSPVALYLGAAGIGVLKIIDRSRRSGSLAGIEIPFNPMQRR